ncbi:hypothetical protein EDEG_00558 [Edhazardia aedis USNM 41457]|uniref:Uncharacterized protein n=1 Tax=Edhazardia aedis (strain USNM 41457) TaxID=1003232 RepID=J9DF52_EDHAE|nr:hypothetical protein EDEG_00558 [Edhazardia aedis USNM 41457]|eukprot:EJW01225.1 hypothetical protein EDEG_00558 [Edhazardia aedis USNM 41457]
MSNILPSITKIKYESVTMPNKNIQSYFMKSEASYYVKNEEKYTNYRGTEEAVIILLTPDDLMVGTSLEDCKIITRDKSKYHDNLVRLNSNVKAKSLKKNTKDDLKIEEKPKRSNLTDLKENKEQNFYDDNSSGIRVTAFSKEEEYIENRQDATIFNNVNEIETDVAHCSLINNKVKKKEQTDFLNTDDVSVDLKKIFEDKLFFQNLYDNSNFSKKNLSSTQQLQNFLFNKINSIKKIAKSSFIIFVFNDDLSRGEVIPLIDLILNHVEAKGILMLPLSLAMCFGLNTGNGIVINQQKNIFQWVLSRILCLFTAKDILLTKINLSTISLYSTRKQIYPRSLQQI